MDPKIDTIMSYISILFLSRKLSVQNNYKRMYIRYFRFFLFRYKTFFVDLYAYFDLREI